MTSWPAHTDTLSDAIDSMARADTAQRGAVLTRAEVVEFILDLIGYTPDKPLHTLRLLEPAFGHGDFLIPAVTRLLESSRGDADLTACVRAVELHQSSYDTTVKRLRGLFQARGVHAHVARSLIKAWLVRGDFLLASLPGHFDFVVGNPPYIRQELVPDVLMAEYRARYGTIYDRADIYIPFMERSLRVLGERGTLGFICSDRWMKNRYGQRLRALVSSNFRLKFFVDMVNTQAFKSHVTAYPAITVMARENPGPTRAAYAPAIETETLRALSRKLLAPAPPQAEEGGVCELPWVVAGSRPWLLEASSQLDLVRRLEEKLPSLEDAGCRVGIGVATGADKSFIGVYESLDVEEDRKLPLVMTRDLVGGDLCWRGFGVINPFTDSGGLVDLAHHPRLRRYLEQRRAHIAGRHVAKKNPTNWYRTIDRIDPALVHQPKLLIPDIKGEAHVVYDAGQFYPHHNLYYITSKSWDMRALQAVLLSGMARLFVAAYSTRMRGGYLRFQAQYLRRIRLPAWASVSAALRTKLIWAAQRRDRAACNQATLRLYDLDAKDASVLLV